MTLRSQCEIKICNTGNWVISQSILLWRSRKLKIKAVSLDMYLAVICLYFWCNSFQLEFRGEKISSHTFQGFFSKFPTITFVFLIWNPPGNTLRPAIRLMRENVFASCWKDGPGRTERNLFSRQMSGNIKPSSRVRSSRASRARLSSFLPLRTPATQATPAYETVKPSHTGYTVRCTFPAAKIHTRTRQFLFKEWSCANASDVFRSHYAGKAQVNRDFEKLLSSAKCSFLVDHWNAKPTLSNSFSLEERRRTGSVYVAE